MANSEQQLYRRVSMWSNPTREWLVGLYPTSPTTPPPLYRNPKPGSLVALIQVIHYGHHQGWTWDTILNHMYQLHTDVHTNHRLASAGGIKVERSGPGLQAPDTDLCQDACDLLQEVMVLAVHCMVHRLSVDEALLVLTRNWPQYGQGYCCHRQQKPPPWGM
jgi:hypothetical protein